MGILSFGLAFALLTGNPIAGALLTPHHLWQRPLIFAAVSLSRSSQYLHGESDRVAPFSFAGLCADGSCFVLSYLDLHHQAKGNTKSMS